MSGPGNARHGLDDALGRIGRDALVRLLAAYYRDLGWWVEEIDAARPRLDDEVGFRMRRNDECVLVHCGHWGAEPVPHGAVLVLLGAMVDTGASGAILVGGEFSAAAIETAARHGRVKLIDGEALHGMLGALPEQPEPADPFVEAEAPTPRASSRRPAPVRPRRWPWWALALVCAFGFVLIVRAMLDRTADTAGEPPPDVPKPPRPTIVIYEVRSPAEVSGRRAADAERLKTPPRRPTEAEIRESQRKADEAVRVIEETTPEL